MDRGNLNPKAIMTSEVYFFLCSLLPPKMTEEQNLFDETIALQKVENIYCINFHCILSEAT